MSLDTLLAHLRAHEPATPLEERSLRRLLAMVEWLPRPFDETADPAHLTASAIVVDGEGHVVMHRHKRLGIWLQPGGHIDPGESAPEAVVREVAEEAGALAEHVLGDRPLHVDVHEGPRGHVHLDLRYLLRLPAGATFAPEAGESQAVRWMTYAEAAAVGDQSVVDAVAAAERALNGATR